LASSGAYPSWDIFYLAQINAIGNLGDFGSDHLIGGIRDANRLGSRRCSMRAGIRLMEHQKS
jgi:hypothetical protein